MHSGSLFCSWLQNPFALAFLLTLSPSLTMTFPGQSHKTYHSHIPKPSWSLEVVLFFLSFPLSWLSCVNRANYSRPCFFTYIDPYISLSGSYCYGHSTRRPSQHARSGTSYFKTFTASRCSWCRCTPSSQSFWTCTTRSPSLASRFFSTHHSIGTTLSGWGFLNHRNCILCPPYGKISHQWT